MAVLGLCDHFFRHRGVVLSLCAELLRLLRHPQCVSCAGVKQVIRILAR